MDINFVMEYFRLTMDGNKGILSDKNGDNLILIHDSDNGTVHTEDT